MFRNYLKIAVRNLIKNKLFSFINIIGLSLGIASSILIFLFIRNELSYDRFHENADRLYRIYITEDPPDRDAFSYVEAPYNLAGALENSFPEVEHAVRMEIRTDVIKFAEKSFTQRYHLVDQVFFDVFNFPLVNGNKESVLSNLDSAVVTQSTAEKIFGNSDPIGQRISVKLGDTFHDFIVTGIAEDPPVNSSIRFDLLIPFGNVPKFRSQRTLSNWFSVNYETYVVLNRYLDPLEIEPKLKQVVLNNYPERYADMVTLHLQPITAIHLNPDVPVGFEPASNPLYARIMMGIAILILSIACFNFLSLSIGGSVTRAKEVGVRKVMGAVKPQLIMQFLGETIFMSMVALILGLILAKLFLPTFNMIINKKLYLSIDLLSVFFLLVLTLLTGIMAGVYPSFFLSRFQPIHIMRRETRKTRAGLLVKGLVIGQFVLSIGFIICTLVMTDQLKYLLKKDLGYNKEHVIVMTNFGSSEESRTLVDRFRNSLAAQSEILGVTGTSTAFAKDWTTMGFRDTDGTFRMFNQLTVDYEYLDTMGIQLKKGRNFSKEFGTDQNSAIIVNEAFIRYFHWDSGLGKNLPSNHFPKHQIIGVVKDFHFEDLKKVIAPLAIVLDPTVLFQGISDINTAYSPRNLNFINIRTRGSDFHLVISLLENTWQKVAPGHPFQFSFLDQDIQQQYQEIERWETIVGTAAVFTILIACLGLYGLAALTVSRRKKEIGVRKVLGASTSNIVVILSRDFGKLVLAANIVAWPVSYIIMHGWLKAFAFRIRPGIDNFVMAAVLALFIALLAVSYQSIKAALSDPVEAIRYE